nr:unnamed protein product [Callosobruchus chinensis]
MLTCVICYAECWVGVLTADLLNPISKQTSLCLAPRCNLLTISCLLFKVRDLRVLFFNCVTHDCTTTSTH